MLANGMIIAPSDNMSGKEAGRWFDALYRMGLDEGFDNGWDAAVKAHADDYDKGFEAGRQAASGSTLRDNGDEPPEEPLAAIDEMLKESGA